MRTGRFGWRWSSSRVQKYTLILGGLLFIVVIFTTPKIQYNHGSIYHENYSAELANIVDYRSALIRGVGVIGLTIALWFAFGKKNEK